MTRESIPPEDDIVKSPLRIAMRAAMALGWSARERTLYERCIAAYPKPYRASTGYVFSAERLIAAGVLHRATEQPKPKGSFCLFVFVSPMDLFQLGGMVDRAHQVKAEVEDLL